MKDKFQAVSGKTKVKKMRIPPISELEKMTQDERTALFEELERREFESEMDLVRKAVSTKGPKRP